MTISPSRPTARKRHKASAPSAGTPRRAQPLRASSPKGAAKVVVAESATARVSQSHDLCLDPKQPGTTALRHLLDQATEAVAARRRHVLDRAAPEDVRQLRLSLRRLRCLLKAARPLRLDLPAARRLAVAARDLGRLSALLRDIDALQAGLIDATPSQAALTEADRQAVSVELAAVRAARIGSVCTALDGELWLQFEDAVAACRSGVDRCSGDAPALRAWADASLHRAWHTVKKRGRLIANLDDDERHDLRKDVKQLQLGVRVFRSLYRRKQVETFNAALRALNGRLGQLNDVASAEAIVRPLVRDGAVTAPTALMLGVAIGWHAAATERERPSLAAAWEALDTAPRFWR